MDFDFSEEQRALRDSVRRFLAERAPIRPYVRTMLDDPRGTTDDVWAGLASLGVTGLLVPEANGGAGIGMVDMAVVLEEMGRAVHPGPFLSSAVASVLAVTAVGSDGDRARLLPALADGSRVAALALEPPLPSAAAAGDGWAVTGALDAVADAGSCDTLLVRARVDGGEALFELDRRGAAVTCTPVISVDGTRKAAAVTLAGAPATRLGGAGDAAAALDAVIDRVVAALVVDGVGAAEAALAIAVEYAAQREQFGRPIGSFQAVQHLCADMLHDVELARAGAYYAVWACDQLPADAHRAVTMAKAFAGDALAAVGASTIQVLGGVGFTWEHDAHLFYKRLLTLQQAYGSSRQHLEALASLVLDG